MFAENEIVQWDTIQKDFEGGLLFLGNGSSIALSSGFNYKKLRDKAVELKHIDKDSCKIFENLGTENFEKVLEYLYIASKVSDSIGDDKTRIMQYYNNIRNGLIETIKAIHPSYHGIKDDLKKICIFISKFETIIDLNYDLIAYWGVMMGKDNQAADSCSWCLYDDFFRQGGEFKSENVNEILNKKKVIVYPHGNLVICKPLKSEKIKTGSKEQEAFENQELKICAKRNKENYWSILSLIQAIDFLEPVFVAEGTKKEKEEMIKNSPYLKTIFLKVLPKIECKTITFLGFSFSDNDQHIVEKLLEARNKHDNEVKIAVSVYNDDREIMERASKMLESLSFGGEIKFFHVENCGWPQHGNESNEE